MGLFESLDSTNRINGASQSTISKDRAYLTTLLKYCPGLDAPSRSELETLIIRIREHYKSKNSQRTSILVLKKILRILDIPHKWIKIPRYHPTHTYADNLTGTELTALFSVANPEERAMLILLMFGLRRSEALDVQLKDLKIQTNEIFVTVRKSKTLAGERTLLIPEKYAPYLMTWIHQHPNKTDPNANLLTFKRTSMQHKLQLLAASAGLHPTRIHPHAFRHTCASFLIDKLNEIELMQHMGWTTNNMVKVYCHINPVQLHDKIRQLFA